MENGEKTKKMKTFFTASAVLLFLVGLLLLLSRAPSLYMTVIALLILYCMHEYRKLGKKKA